jgi:hypothetical protein
MTRPVLSTYKILKEKAFNSDIDDSWVDWAIEMIEAGYEADSLYELAGISKPYNQFELHELTSRVLKALQLDYSNPREALRDYVYYLIASNIDKPENYDQVLSELMDAYFKLDMPSEYEDFALLYWAREDLHYSDYQDYWVGADKTNIQRIIKEQFDRYLNNLARNNFK